MTPAQTTHPLPPVGRRYGVAGRQLYLHRSGTGRPVVVILPGAGMFGLGYFNIQSQVAELATSVIYDRAGTGWSDAAPLPRSLADVVEELRELLRAADLQGPYLFVAHSLGGLYARRFAQLYPGEVAGLLLLDPAHEDSERVALTREELLELLSDAVELQPGGVPPTRTEVVEMVDSHGR
jgi:pimeloyl-ACP methyl ester carboxylesterase